MLLVQLDFLLRMKKSVLGIKGILEVMSYLIENKDSKIHATDLQQVISNYPRLNDILETLEEKNLSEIKIQTKPVRSKCVLLTSKGEIISRKMLELEAEIESQE